MIMESQCIFNDLWLDAVMLRLSGIWFDLSPYLLNVNVSIFLIFFMYKDISMWKEEYGAILYIYIYIYIYS